MQDFGEKQGEPTPILCDNKFAIPITKNSVFHNQTKHEAHRHHFIRDVIEEN